MRFKVACMGFGNVLLGFHFNYVILSLNLAFVLDEFVLRANLENYYRVHTKQVEDSNLHTHRRENLKSYKTGYSYTHANSNGCMGASNLRVHKMSEKSGTKGKTLHFIFTFIFQHVYQLFQVMFEDKTMWLCSSESFLAQAHMLMDGLADIFSSVLQMS
jgi:hypothetical protein